MTRVLTDASGKKATGVEYFDRDGEKHMQPASVVICASWAAQNPRLLLNSATDKHPNGLANASGLVGKYIMTHITAVTNAMFDDDLEPAKGTIGGQYMSYERYSKTAHKGAFGSTLLVCRRRRQGERPDRHSQRPARFVRRRSRRFHEARRQGLHALSRRPAKSSRRSRTASNSSARRTSSECRSPASSTTMTTTKWRLWNANLEEGLKIGRATDAKDVWQVRTAMPAIHLMGGTIMGTGADNSVVNSYGQTHEVPNLYVAGPGIFPTCGASNPTYTVFALSLRAAENLASNWGAIAG